MDKRACIRPAGIPHSNRYISMADAVIAQSPLLRTKLMQASVFFADYAAFTHYIDTLGVFHINPSLNEIGAVLKSMQLSRPPFAVIQVLGTNGKGSTSAMLSALCHEHGLTTGLFTSPHFVSPRERILINNTPVPEEDWVRSANLVMQHGGETLTYFELLTVMALHMFAQNNTQIAIIEAGLGGSWDSTTAITADMHVYTPIGLDHLGILGNSLQEIAEDKAGAIRSNAPVISAQQEPAVKLVLMSACGRNNAPLYFADKDFSLLPDGFNPEDLPLRGAFQGENIRLALTAFTHIPEVLHRCFRSGLRILPTPQSLVSALTKAWIAGRFQHIAATEEMPPFILDGAHNPHAMAALGLSLAKKGTSPAAVIFTCLNDKQPEHIIPHLRALATGPIFVPPLPAGNSRAMPPERLAAMIGIQAQPMPSLAQAIEDATRFRKERLPGIAPDDHPILICGSLYLLSEFYKEYPQYLAHLT